MVKLWESKRGYEHLERIDVNVWDRVKQWDQIGTCWSTWNSTQYHLHLQVDKWFAPFHPYRSQDIEDIRKYTIDPLPYLRSQNPGQLYLDMPNELHYEKAIRTLTKSLIIKWYNRHIAPDQTLQRYEAALMIDRTLRLYSLYDNRSIVTEISSPYTDVDVSDPELLSALDRLQSYGIMKWHKDSLYPNKELQWEELLALLWRIFYWLSDTNTAKRYDNYLIAFIEKEIITDNRSKKQ